MGFLNDIIKTVVDAGKSAIRDEVRSETRGAVRDAVQGAKNSIGKASKAAADSAQHDTVTTASVRQDLAMAGSSQQEAIATNPVRQEAAATNPMRQGTAIAGLANLDHEQRKELEQILAFQSSPEQQKAAAEAIRQNGPEIEAKLREAGIDPDKLKKVLDNGNEASEALKKTLG